MKRYTITQFHQEYPDDNACLEEVFRQRYGDLTVCPGCGVTPCGFYRIRKRKCWCCKDCGYQLHPLAGTVFHKSSTPLKLWFYAIYLFSVSKNGVSAKELERQLGVTYKCAWRIAKQVRILMVQDSQRLSGVVEADEAYIGGVARGSTDWKRYKNKTEVMGLVERGGNLKAVAKEAHLKNAQDFLQASVNYDTTLYTDKSPLYSKSAVSREVVNHSAKEFVRGDVHTNTIEGFWSQFKRSLNGTYHAVSPKYLPLYLDEFVTRYNLRGQPAYPSLVKRAGKRV